MTDAVTVTNGKAEMAFKGEVPWHGLGQELKAGASIDVWVKEAGMAWEVLRDSVRFNSGGGVEEVWKEKNVLYRSDNAYPLGLVSEGYKIVQPRQCMEFFRDLCESNEFEVETAGTLFGGRRYWALARIGEEAHIVKGDKVKGYLLLTTSADGTKATTGKFVATRVVCNNTLSIAMRETEGKAVHVTHRAEFVADDVKIDLGIGRTVFKDFVSVCKTLSEKPMSETVAQRFVKNLLVQQGLAKPEVEIADVRAYCKILDLYNVGARGAELPGVKGTAWGLLNAVTEFVDHQRARGDPSINLSRQVWFGPGDRLKTAAFAMARDFQPSSKKDKNKV